jgi:chromosome segregation ATPase
VSSIIGNPLGGPSSPPPPPPPSSGGGGKIVALFVAVVISLGASGYLFYQVNHLRSDLADTRDALLTEIAKVHETSALSTQTSRRSVEELQKQLEAARHQASMLAGQAKIDATKHADELAAKLEQVQTQQAQKVNAVTADLSKVKVQASTTQGKVGQVSTEVDTLKTKQADTQSQLEKTIAELKTARGDMGIQSGLIATNSSQLAALKALGERNYTEFTLAKEKHPTKVGDVQIRLTKADPKHNRYTIELIADDKKVEKKDRTVNEPVQFLLARATQPYELVVNDVKKNLIKGYLSAPKVQQARK